MYTDPKYDALVVALKEIEEKYEDFFKNREGREHQEHDMLENHWMIRAYSGERNYFQIRNDSDLPEYIRKDCFETHRKIYGNDN